MLPKEKITEAVEQWRQSKGRMIIISPVRTGKTFIALTAIEHFLSKNPTAGIVIGVPSKSLEFQWNNILNDRGLDNRVKVGTFEYIMKKFKKIPFLIIDEVHTSCSPEAIKIYSTIKFKFFLGLTATLNRLDGREKLILEQFPVIETCTKEEAMRNGWIEKYKEYKVILDVDDIKTFKEHDSKFQRYFEFFNNDFNTAMKCVTSAEMRRAIANWKRCKIEIVNACTFGFNRELKFRIAFVQNHPKKIEIAKRIIEKRDRFKTIVYSPTIKTSENFGPLLYNSEMKSKDKETALNTFISQSEGVLSVVDSLSMGVELNGCNTAIILSHNSSYADKEQKIGRLLSKNESRIIPCAFTLVLKNTMEEAWFKNSTGRNEYYTLTERMLYNLLDGEDVNEERIEGPDLLYHY